jgi:cell division septation protein DedD
MSPACLFLGVATAAALTGCVSSEETGGTGRANRPQVMMRPVDTPRVVAPTQEVRDTADAVATQNPATRTKRPAPVFKTKLDTVRVATVRTQKPAVRATAPIERPANPTYTLQIGAFSRAENALRAQKRAHRQFPDIPILNVYVPSARLYRVSVGRFESRSAANAFRLELLKHYPKEYAQCWINYVAR